MVLIFLFKGIQTEREKIFLAIFSNSQQWYNNLKNKALKIKLTLLITVTNRL